MNTLQAVCARLAGGQSLPYADALTEPAIRDALDEHGR
jgi:hypothetical protein